MHRLASLISVASVAAVALVLGACGGGQPEGTNVAVSGANPTVTDTGTATSGAAPVALASPIAISATAPARDLAPASVSVCADPTFRARGVEMAFIVATSPFAGESVRSGFPVHGCANVNEGTVQWRLKGADASVVAEGVTQASCGTGCVGDFVFNVEYPPLAGGQQAGSLELFSTSMRDGTEENLSAIALMIE
jgi:hypothetical protein